MNVFKFAIFFIILCTILTGCNSNEKSAENFQLPSIAPITSNNAADKVDVDIYFDATYSMQGYTTLAAGNVYRTLPDLLGDIAGSMGAVKFYRFGETIQPLDGRDYRSFSSPEPYNELITAVHNVIDKADDSHLSIIVTDLFESEADWSNISQKIRDKYFAKHQAVAIIGIKNSFNGDIFDVGLNAAKFKYNSYDYPERFRPFYLLLLGNVSAITDFMQKFKDRQTLPNETEYLLLSENLTDSSNDFSTLQTDTMQNFFAEDNLGIRDKRIKEFELDNFNKPASFTLTFDYKPQLGACPIDMSTLTPAIQVMSLDNDEWQIKSDNDINVEMIPIDEHYDVKLSLTPENSLVDKHINFIQISISPMAKGYNLPDWIRNWSMANVDAAPETFDGSKTVNLINIISSLKDSVFAASRPSLMNINFIVNAR